MMQGIAAQVLNESPSETPATVSANSESKNNEAPINPNPKTDDFDHRFGVLAKMERKLKEQEGNFKNRSKEWEDKDKKLSEMEEFMQLMDENPLEAIKKRKGWGLQELNEYAVKNSSDEDLDPVAQITKNYETKMAEMRAELMKEFDEKISAKEAEISGKDKDRQVVEFKSGISNFLAENKDTYEFIHAEEGGAEAVFELIYEDIQLQLRNEVPQDQLKAMDIKEAAEKIESFLDKRYSKFLGLNKVKSRFKPSDDERFGKFITKSTPSTIDSSFSPKSKSVDSLDPQERKQAAIDFIKSQKT